MTWKLSRWLVIDTETTGLDPAADRIVELAAVWMQAGEVAERRCTLLNPGIPIPEAASAVHGITDERVVGKPRLEDVARRFCAMVRQAEVIVGYNAPFDVAFLAAQCPGWGDAASHAPVIDSLTVVRLDGVGRFWKGPGRHKLASVCERLRIAGDGPYHSASTDAVMAGRVLWHLRDHLPDDLGECESMLRAARVAQERDFEAWKAAQAAKGAA